ncbi:helix-turn-helix domain-containing protein [Mucilaginibacter terrenus]|uniref:Helix-turn-helix domain-containing protein n=1 Tax=Mucilaginibacter terrenus TaxID=2482727 RepID=A0A3E2NVV6_9SPHI|nr:helix-turn-helix transcriptional regulator [Mucilaginibacter terrenus]RFZ85145.1 helix-turn-helix domain-containing protein [Mucilaginibacter terrenus]
MKQLNNLLPDYRQDGNGNPAFDIRMLTNIDENSLIQRNGQFLIIWITRGQGTYCISEQRGLIGHNHLLFIQPGQLSGIQLHEEAEGYAISFNTSFLNRPEGDITARDGSFYQVFARNQTITTGPETEEMQSITAIMLREFSRNHLYRREILKQYLKIFLMYLAAQMDHSQLPRQTRNEAILESFMALLEKNFRTQKMVSDYAEAISVTPNYLNEVIKKMTGHSAGHHIRQRVAQEAKRQAVFSNSCMKGIAYDLGFYDMAHFSKFFKNTTGMNFSDFKNSDRVLKAVI